MKILLVLSSLLVGCSFDSRNIKNDVTPPKIICENVVGEISPIVIGDLRDQWINVSQADASKAFIPRITGGETSISKNQYVFDVYNEDNILLQTITVTPFIDIFAKPYIDVLLGKSTAKAKVINVVNHK